MERVLTRTNEYVCLSEEEAYELIQEARTNMEVENTSIKQKKETKKKVEHWIVIIKERVSIVDNYVSTGE